MNSKSVRRNKNESLRSFKLFGPVSARHAWSDDMEKLVWLANRFVLQVSDRTLQLSAEQQTNVKCRHY